MRSQLRIVISLGAAALLGLAGVAGVARLTSGPIGPFPGGAFDGPGDAGAAFDAVAVAEVRRIALQVGDPEQGGARTITTLVVGDEGRVYVSSAVGARKRWPSELLEHPTTVLRIAGRLYQRRAVRVSDPEERAAVRDAFAAKYGTPPGREDPEGTWVFRMDRRAPEAP